ncbi:MAG: hypothetical protein IPK16_33110 [Anaerolineales bacterium]|nr:hypothetical protein [Anaerolineales bacterium]
MAPALWDQILHEIAPIPQQEVRWHVAQLIPRLQLSEGERQVAVEVLTEYLDDHSRIVVVFSMQALVELAARCPAP